MREIKFRAWHKSNKSMCCNVTTDLLVRDYLEFMQYTGLKDKNGKEIYEEDILMQNNNRSDLVQVCFGKFGIRNMETEEVIDVAEGWYLKVIETDALSMCEPFCYDMALNNQWINVLDIKVIGNIYENPELLDK